MVRLLPIRLSATKMPTVPFHTLLFPAYLMGSKDPWTKLNSISTTGKSLSIARKRRS